MLGIRLAARIPEIGYSEEAEMAEDRNPSSIDETEEIGRATDEEPTATSDDDELDDTEDMDEDIEK